MNTSSQHHQFRVKVRTIGEKNKLSSEVSIVPPLEVALHDPDGVATMCSLTKCKLSCVMKPCNVYIFTVEIDYMISSASA